MVANSYPLPPWREAEAALRRRRSFGYPSMPRSGDFPGVSLEAFSKVVEAVYDCALDPTGWHHAVHVANSTADSRLLASRFPIETLQT